MSLELNAIIATGSAAAVGLVAQLPDGDQLAALGKWPVTLALIALAAWSVWLMYRQANRANDTLDRVSTRLGELCQRLSERPCIRDPKND